MVNNFLQIKLENKKYKKYKYMYFCRIYNKVLYFKMQQNLNQIKQLSIEAKMPLFTELIDKGICTYIPFMIFFMPVLV